jgi:hypothetical protein
LVEQVIPLLFVLAQVDPATLDGLLDAMAAVPPGDYARYQTERARVLALGADAVPLLKIRGAADQWTATGWVRAMAAESCRIRLESPALAAGADRPRGLDPKEYLMFRRPQPTCAAEMSRMGSAAVPLFIERWRWTFDAFAFSDGEAGGAEREAFRLAILELPGRVADARGRFFLEETLRSAGWPQGWRAAAAVSLGACGGADALVPLQALLGDAAAPVAVREACARGLGRIPDVRALDALRSRLGVEGEDLQVIRSTFAGLGWIGSRWGWASRGAAVAAAADTVRKGVAEALVGGLKQFPSESETIGRALALTAWPDSLPAVEALLSDPSPAVRAAAQSVLDPLRSSLQR